MNRRRSGRGKEGRRLWVEYSDPRRYCKSGASAVDATQYSDGYGAFPVAGLRDRTLRTCDGVSRLDCLVS